MLSNALRKRHPYRAFKDKINELGISQLYYDYRSQAYLDKAEEWCRENCKRTIASTVSNTSFYEIIPL